MGRVGLCNFHRVVCVASPHRSSLSNGDCGRRRACLCVVSRHCSAVQHSAAFCCGFSACVHSARQQRFASQHALAHNMADRSCRCAASTRAACEEGAGSCERASGCVALFRCKRLPVVSACIPNMRKIERLETSNFSNPTRMSTRYKLLRLHREHLKLKSILDLEDRAEATPSPAELKGSVHARQAPTSMACYRKVVRS